MVYVGFTVLLLVAVLIGFALGKAQRKPVSKAEMKELQEAQDFIDTLTAKAGEHSALGDDFAVITLDDIRRYNTRVRALR